MDFRPLEYIYKASGSPDANTLLLLHGTGGDENDLLPVAKYFGDKLNVLSVRGNVSEGGMPRFFRRLGMGIFDEQDLTFRTHELVAFLKECSVKEGFDLHKIIALGYSNGANIAGSTLLLYPDLLAGAILYRPMQPFKDPGTPVQPASPVPVFMSNGTADPTIDPATTQQYKALLQQCGFEVAAYMLDTGHGLTQEDLQLSTAWYKEHFH